MSKQTESIDEKGSTSPVQEALAFLRSTGTKDAPQASPATELTPADNENDANDAVGEPSICHSRAQLRTPLPNGEESSKLVRILKTALSVAESPIETTGTSNSRVRATSDATCFQGKDIFPGPRK